LGAAVNAGRSNTSSLEVNVLKIARLTISNFRGIKTAEFHFDGHALIIGTNNVGKSTICEALDLVLGPDRLSRLSPIEEFDFYNAEYLSKPATEGEQSKPIPIRVEVVLIDLTSEVENRCGANLEFWRISDRSLLGGGEVEAANPPDVVPCLRLEMIGRYDIEEDEFEGKTYFSHSPNAEEGELTAIPKNVKRLFGFLYLRALRTGTRALSLERGSLLDNILRLQGVRTGLWEKAIDRLRNLEIEKDAVELEPVLKSIEERLSRYVPSGSLSRATKLHVSQLTREHLRKTMAFFLAMSKDQCHVPFQQAGTGTLNTLVLALLTFIADLKPATVIFAMEEPEIAVPPHTQRRIADYLLQNATQAFVTSHSPYVIERFEPRQTLLLVRNDDDGSVSAKRISDAVGLRDNDYKRYARRGLTECMLGRGAIVVEGVTEFHALPVIARKLEETDPGLQSLDTAGVAFFDAESDGPMPKFGAFFKALGLKTFSFYDLKERKADDKDKFTRSFDIDCEHTYAGFEALVIAEVPVDRQWMFLADLRVSGESGRVRVPAQRPADAAVKEITKQALLSHKGAGWAARLFESCSIQELPATVTAFLKRVYDYFPKPSEPQPAINEQGVPPSGPNTSDQG
jgi:putative ATP-dependent endonuclease of the OLD family